MSKRKSNSALQLAMSKYGLESFNFCVYEFFTYDNKQNSGKLLTDLETLYIKKFNFTSLYNFMRTATSLEGYKHTEQAKLLISKPGVLNPMYGKFHTDESKNLMRERKRKYGKGVNLYDLDNNLIIKFDYASDLAKHLKVSKVTVSKYLNKGLVYKKKYYIKCIEN